MKTMESLSCIWRKRSPADNLLSLLSYKSSVSALSKGRIALRPFSFYSRSLPLNHSWRFRRNVVNHSRHTRHLVHDPCGDPLEHLTGQPSPIRSHRIVAIHYPHCHREAIGSSVAHDSDASHGQKYGERLPGFFV